MGEHLHMVWAPVCQYLQKTGQIKAMEEVAPQQLSEYEIGLLKRLRVWIYEKRRKALKDSLKTSRPKMNEPSPKDQGELFLSDQEETRS